MQEDEGRQDKIRQAETRRNKTKQDETRRNKTKQDETRRNRNKTKQNKRKLEKTKFVEVRRRTYGQVHAGPSNASHVDLSLGDGQRGSRDGDSVPVQVVPPIVREDDRSCING